MISRKSFLLGAVMLPAALLPYKRRYPQVGYLSADTAAARVEKVLLDGRDISRVFELDDAEGWLRRYTDEIDGDALRIERLEGIVEVVWRG
jgi:hypothetical protein